MLIFFERNPIFYNIILFLFLTNFVLTIIVDIKEQKKENKKESLDKITNIKIKIMFMSVLLFLVIISLKVKNLFNILVFILIPAIFLIKSIYVTYKKEQTLSIDDKFSNLWAMYIFFLFFSSQAIQLFYNLYSSLNHCIKEILLICYLLLKMSLFIYFLLQNIIIFVSNITILIPSKSKINKPKNILDKFINYDFYFYKKFNSNMALITDVLIFFLLSVPIIVIYIFKNLFLKSFSNFIVKFKTKIKNAFIIRSNKTIRKIINISIIIIVSIVHIIIITNPSTFSSIIKEIYSFLSTVILIPFVYDSIKSN